MFDLEKQCEAQVSPSTRIRERPGAAEASCAIVTAVAGLYRRSDLERFQARAGHKPHVYQHQRRGARPSSPRSARSVHKLARQPAVSRRFKAFEPPSRPDSVGDSESPCEFSDILGTDFSY